MLVRIRASHQFARKGARAPRRVLVPRAVGYVAPPQRAAEIVFVAPAPGSAPFGVAVPIGFALPSGVALPSGFAARDAPPLSDAPAPKPARSRQEFAEFLASVRLGDVIHVVLPPPSDEPATSLLAVRADGSEAAVSLPPDADLIRFLSDANVSVSVAEESLFQSLAKNAASVGVFLAEIVAMYAIAAIVFRLIGGSGAAGGFGRNPFVKNIGGDGSVSGETETGVTFAQVAGATEAKADLVEIVDFLKNPERYSAVGAKIPRGVLLYGPPGCGKTLLARAIAGEAGVPFFACSGSDFIEMFAGLGASRVRELFSKAKEAAPCIVFIDELDAVGRARGGNVPGAASNDERDQTINQLLTAMDGFSPNAGVIVIAATNRADILDPALLRPGRFDRRVAVELPDFVGRAEILAVHTRTRPIAPDVSLASYARVTVGFSGAELENLCNEAAIYAARANSATITTEHLEAAFERVVLGEARTTVLITDEKKRLLAFHEAGHALMSVLVGDYDLCRKVSIVPRGKTSGATYFETAEDRLDMSLLTRDYLEAKIMVAYGGRIAEELVFGTMNVTTGASGDLQEVYRVAHQMVTAYGFNEKLGRVAWNGADGGPDGEIGAEIRFIVKRLYARARDLLSEQLFYLHRIAEELVQKEVLRTDDIVRLTQGMVCFARKPYSSYEEDELGGADH